MDEQQKFKEWVDTFPTRKDAAKSLRKSDSSCYSVAYIYSLLSRKRTMNDKLRAAWRRAGGKPDDVVSDQVAMP